MLVHLHLTGNDIVAEVYMCSTECLSGLYDVLMFLLFNCLFLHDNKDPNADVVGHSIPQQTIPGV